MKYRPCFQCAVSAMAAVGLCVFLHNEIAWILTAAGVALAAVFIFITFKDKEKRLHTVISTLAILCCIFRFGMAYTEEYEYAVKQTGSMKEVTAYAVSPLADSYLGDERWLMQITSLNREQPEHPIEIAVTVESDLNLQFGDSVRFYTPVKRLYEYTVGDTTAKELGTGVFLKGTIDDESKVSVLGPVKLTFSLMMEKNKQKLCALSDACFSPEASQIFKGMLYGDKRNMEENILIDFRYSGFAHLLAVSGLHIQVIFGLITALLTKLLYPVKARRQVSSIVSLAAVWGFILLIGCPISAVRSGIMVTVTTFGSLIAKRSDTLNSLGVSVVVIELLMPFSVCDLGFWMSVLATFGIGSVGTYFSRILQKHTNDRLEEYRLLLLKQSREKMNLHPENISAIRRELLKKRQKRAKWTVLRNKVIRSFLPGIASSVGLMPIYMFYFGYVPLGSILFGPFLSVLFNTIALLGVFFTVFGLLSCGPGIEICGLILQPLLDLLGAAVGWVADIPALVIPLRREFAVIFCAFAVIGFLISKKEICKKLFGTEKRLRIGVFLVSFYVLGLLFTQYYEYNIVEVAAVGGYESSDVVVTAKNKASVFICCDSEDNEENVFAYLRQRGIWKVDHIYLMMPYNGVPDGVLFLKDQMQVNNVHYNCYGLPSHYVMTPIASGDSFLTEEIVLTFVYSEEGLNAAIKHGESEICILQDVSLSDTGGISADGSDAVFLYDPIGIKEAQMWETDCLVLLSDINIPYAVSSGKTVRFSGQIPVIEFDLQGNIHLP